MQAGKGYSVTLDRPAELPQLCSLLHEARVAVTPINSSLRIGGTMEMSGIDESITQARVDGIIAIVPEYFPAFRVEDFERTQALARTSPLCSRRHALLGTHVAMEKRHHSAPGTR